MIVAEDHAALREALASAAAADNRPVALVPTMGNLHAGHGALVSKARELAGTVAVSIFVNPTQFAPGEDFERYPRTLDHDRALLEEARADVLFLPSVEDMYPYGTAGSVRVRLPALTDVLCGASRPGHFDGVATVVTKLFAAARPDLAVFGAKDYQQLLVIERLNRDLGFGIEIVRAETVREADGLALSSRNVYLSDEARSRAPWLHRALCLLRDRIAAGAAPGDARGEALALLHDHDIEPEYLELRCASDLGEVTATDRALVALIAARVGDARLIDNVPVARPPA